MGVIDPPSIRKALEFYEQAVALDPDFGQAWARVSQASSGLYFFSTPTPVLAERAKQAAERAVVLDSGRPEGYLALGTYERLVVGDLNRALEQFAHGQRIAQGDSHLLGESRWPRRLSDDGKRRWSTSGRRSASIPARPAATRIRRRPGRLGTLPHPGLRLAGRCDERSYYAEEARRTFEEQLGAAAGDSQRHVVLGLALAYLGRKEEAIREGERSVALLPLTKDAAAAPYNQHQLARIYMLVGEQEKALDVLEPLLTIPYYLSPGWLRIDPNFDPLRKNPRFQKLVAGK